MNANELRIGNIVNDSEHGNITVEQIAKYQEHGSIGIYFRNGSVWVSLELVEPIPLTEEWLVKLGFGASGDCVGCYSNEGIDVFMFDSGLTVTVYMVELKHIQYVHQLQNLYHALTGTELTMK